MQDIVKLVSERAGISETQAQSAVQTVIGFLKEHLPAPIAGQIDGALSNDLSGVTNQIDGMISGGLGSVGGMFGGKKD